MTSTYLEVPARPLAILTTYRDGRVTVRESGTKYRLTVRSHDAAIQAAKHWLGPDVQILDEISGRLRP